MFVCTTFMQCLMRPEEGIGFPGRNGSHHEHAGNGTRSSARAVSALKYCAVSIVLGNTYFIHAPHVYSPAVPFRLTGHDLATRRGGW